MIRDDIFGTLKTALQRGKNLQQTVQSLYNSGYLKEDVDDTLQVLQTSGFQAPNQPPIIKRIITPQKQSKTPVQLGPTTPVISSYAYQYQPQFSQPQIPMQKPMQQPPIQFAQPPLVMPGQQFYQPMPYSPATQNVSAYEQKPVEQVGKMITIIKIAMLIALLGILIVIFVFREELTNFINNL